MLCDGGRAVGEVRVVVEVGEDIAGLAAEAGLKAGLGGARRVGR